MNKISKYNDFLLEKQFNSIIDDIFRIVEEVEGKWTGPNTMTWDYNDQPKKETPKYSDEKPVTFEWIVNSDSNTIKSKLEKFLQNLPKEKIKEYFIKIMNKIKNLPSSLRKKLIVGITGVFLTFVSLSYLITPSAGANNQIFKGGLSQNQTEEIVQLNKDNIKHEHKKSSFKEAQKLVKLAEAGYSDDKGDRGNYIDIPGGKKRFIGTNHGISARILAKYFNEKGITRLLTKKDMMNLSYQTALKIYKMNYWDAQNLSEISDQSVANVIYDGCVNQGIDGMRSVLRSALEENGVEISDSDNIFSKDVLDKANGVDQEKLFNSIKKYREERYRDSQTFDRHGEGWLNRLGSFSYVPTSTSPTSSV